jgi:hypothetical protein
MLFLIVLIGLIAGWIALSNLKSRVSVLEQKLGIQPQTPVVVQQPMYEHEPSPYGAPQFAPPAATSTVGDINTPIPDTGADNFIRWLKTDWLMKLGALFVLLGFGWFVSYAFANNWIGPFGRIALGLIAGSAILVSGHLRMAYNQAQGAVFLVLGSTTVILTLFAARFAYDFFTPASALALMLASAAYVAYVSLVYEREQLAFGSLLLASVSPLLTDAPSPDLFGLFSYLLVVVVGTIWVVYKTGWSRVLLAAIVIVGLYSLPYQLGALSGPDADVGLLFGSIFTALFFATALFGCIRSAKERADAYLMSGGFSGLFILGWTVAAAPMHWQSMFLTAWALVFAVGSYVVYRRTDRIEPFTIFGLVGAGLIAAATAVELDGPALTIAYTIEAALVAVAGSRLMSARRDAFLFPLIVPVILSGASIMSSSWLDGFMHDDFAALLVLTVSLAVVAVEWWGVVQIKKTTHAMGTDAATILTTTASIYALILVWLVLHAGMLLPKDSATMISLVIYTLVGLSLYFAGGVYTRKGMRVGGATLLGFVAARLLLVDVWDMDLAGRVITFFLIGALFISTAFYSRTHKPTATSSQ